MSKKSYDHFLLEDIFFEAFPMFVIVFPIRSIVGAYITFVLPINRLMTPLTVDADVPIRPLYSTCISVNCLFNQLKCFLHELNVFNLINN